VSTTGRRNQYLGLNVLSGYVVIDTYAMSGAKYDDATRTLTVGPGITNGLALAAVSAQAPPGTMVLIGSCPNVGIAGFTLGGGQGDITPYVGLAADQLVEIELVLYDGTVVRANEKSFPDLYWLAKGGGGGFAAATEFVIKTTPGERAE